MSYIKAVQTIADDQTEVASKTQALIDEEGVDSSEIKSFNVEPWGANKFIILLLYGMLREVRKLSSKFGLKVSSPKIKLSSIPKFSTKTGIKASFKWTVNELLKLSTVFGFGMTVALNSKLALKRTMTIVKMGMISSGQAIKNVEAAIPIE